ncbi:MAG: hypothetical protein KDB84_12695, partial [Flavobacteriales bacterium]|nr:hypothetical protein [Flavobacteriales bacterium]
TTCDDGDPNTINDVIFNCTCSGTPATFDCEGTANGTALPGTACDDGDTSTLNDTWTAACECIGTVVNCSADAGSDQMICGTATELNASGTGTWSGTSGLQFTSTTDANTTVTADDQGIFEAYWTTITGGCTATDTVSLTFIVPADAEFSFAQSSYCQNEMPPSPWVAQEGGIFTSTAGLVVDPSTGAIDLGNSIPGTYVITSTFDGQCPSSHSEIITVAPSPDAGWDVPETLCENGDPLDLNTLVTGSAGGSWSGAGVETGMFDPGAITGSVPVTYEVTLGGCTSRSEQTIVVGTAPLVNAGPDAAVCGYTHQLDASSSGPGMWTVPPGVTISPSLTATQATVGATAPGTFTLVWTATNGNCSATDEVTIIFHDPESALFADAGPDQELEVSTTALLNGSASAGASVEWSTLAGAGVVAEPYSASSTVNGLSLGTNILVMTATLGACGLAMDTLLIHVK